MKLEQAARQALDWIDANAPRYVFEAVEKALAEQADQEPVAWIDNKTWCFTYSQYEYEDLDDDMTVDLVPLYAAPVRTKDLTDEDLCKIGEAHALGMECEGYENNMLWYEVNPLPAFRAVIAADREKNK